MGVVILLVSGQILDTDGTVLLCLHQWGIHQHPSLMSPEVAAPGNGLLLFFRVDDYDTILNRARSLVARFEGDPQVNPNTQLAPKAFGAKSCGYFRQRFLESPSIAELLTAYFTLGAARPEARPTIRRRVIEALSSSKLWLLQYDSPITDH